MKALLLTDVNRFEYTDLPVPELGPEDVLIRVKACGICGSDIHGMDGSSGRRIPPLVMGHELAGIVEAIGADVTRWRIGDRVVPDSTVYCGRCQFCSQGLVNLCDNRRVLGVAFGEYRRDGGFAEFLAVPERILYRVPDDVSFVESTMVEPLSIAAHAIRRTAVDPSTSAVVVGTGMIGLLIVQTLRAVGCERIIAIDIDQGRLEQAKAMGAEVIATSEEGDVAARVRELTDARGADVAFEVVGKDATVNLAIEVVRKGGAVVLVGNLDPKISLPLQTVVTRQLTLLGTAASSGEYPWCLDMIAEARIDVGSLISVVAPLEQGASWFERLHQREPGLMKVVLEP